MRAKKSTFFIIAAAILIVGYIAAFGLHTNFLGFDINIKGAPDMRFGIDIRGGIDVAFAPKGLDHIPTDTEMEAARAVIEKRLDNLNILDREVTTDKQGGYLIARFPWKADETEFNPEIAIKELGKMSMLTFREPGPDNSPDPDGRIIITGKNIVNVGNVELSTQGSGGAGYVVPLEMDAAGAVLFAEATGRLVGKPIVIYMDDLLVSAPTVNEQISGGKCVITTSGSRVDAQKLANEIKSGALPFGLETTNYRTISPTLGTNALEAMVTAGIIAFVLICLFALVYYRLTGLMAIFALILQVGGTMLMLSIFQLTVTLSGIAALILSVGMGVDTNVIIGERIREELKSGRTLDSALIAGFKRAFSAVFDGNITTMFAGAILLVFGSGAMLSFAYTLLFGIGMNFLSGVLMNRLMTYSITRNQFTRNPKMFMSEHYRKKELHVMDFYGKRRIIYSISAGALAIGLIFCFIPGFGVQLDIQFKGGAQVQYNINDTLDIDKVGSVAAASLGMYANARETIDIATGERSLVIEIAGGQNLTTDEFIDLGYELKDAFPGEDFTLMHSNNVSPYFAQRFLQNAVLAVLMAAVLMLLYVWFSFRRIHGLSAGAVGLLALLHDVAFVFFTFVVFRIPLNENFVAVTLTILGYSINSTIVNYDRIRENSASKSKAMPLEDMVNLSVSQSMSRNVNTNVTTLASVALVFIIASIHGLDSVRTFALPMGIGLISGWYSSVFVVGPTWVLWEKRKTKRPAATAAAVTSTAADAKKLPGDAKKLPDKTKALPKDSGATSVDTQKQTDAEQKQTDAAQKQTDEAKGQASGTQKPTAGAGAHGQTAGAQRQTAGAGAGAKKRPQSSRKKRPAPKKK
jgi:SecD/SecF fusion protein